MALGRFLMSGLLRLNSAIGYLQGLKVLLLQIHDAISTNVNLTVIPHVSILEFLSAASQ